jgi:NAD(P)-dependent dehydrogenase (short-subunit alcohol dehydrogenase family)
LPNSVQKSVRHGPVIERRRVVDQASHRARSEAGAAEVAAVVLRAGGRAIAVTSDVSTEQGAREPIEAAVDEFGRVDIVVNNAGVLRSAPFADMTPAVWAARSP